MATPCMNPEPHGPHPWAIAANPGEPGPDHFQCDGRKSPAQIVPGWITEPRVGIPLGRVDTTNWVIPETGWYRLQIGEFDQVDGDDEPSGSRCDCAHCVPRPPDDDDE